VFAKLDSQEHGWPDGLCLDDQGGVWSSRWQGGKLIRFNPDGEIDVILEFPGAWNITCAIFGGPRMDSLYVTSASSKTSGDDVTAKPQGGDLFVVNGLGFSGRERNRFRG
jgi:sugar lactone lactonase YvrE